MWCEWELVVSTKMLSDFPPKSIVSSQCVRLCLRCAGQQDIYVGELVIYSAYIGEMLDTWWAYQS